MLLSWLDFLIIGAFLLLSLGIGIYFKKQSEGGLTSFFLGGRSLPWYLAGMSMVATTFAADTPLAVTELVAKQGIAGNWLWWNAVIGGMLTAIFFSRLWQRANVLTEVELISIRYSGKPARYLRYFKAVYLGVFMNVLVIGWVNLALASLLEAFFDLTQFQVYALVFGFMVLASIYTALSGLKGVVYTDAIQFVIAIIGCIILAVMVIGSDEIGGVLSMKEKLPDGYLNFLPEVGAEEGGSSLITLSIGAFISFIGIQWWASWYPGAEPGGGGYIAQRMMSTRSEKDAQYATLFFQIAHYCLRPWPWILVGLCAVLLYNMNLNDSFTHEQVGVFDRIEELKIDGKDIADKDLLAAIQANPKWAALSELQQESVVFRFQERSGFAFAMKDFLPNGLRGLLLVAFLAAYLSTISTQLNWGASYIVNDFVKPMKGELKRPILISRLSTVLLLGVGMYVTTVINSISGVWEFILECGAGVGFVLILRWFWWRMNAWSEIVATIAPFIGYAIGHYYLEPAMNEAFALQRGTFFFTVGFTVIAILITTFITKPTDQKTLQEFASRVNPPGNWQGMNANGTASMFAMVISWLAAVALCYSTLFLLGNLLLREWNSTIYCAIIMAISGLICRWGIGRSFSS